MIYGQNTVNNSNRTIRQLTVLLEYNYLFYHTHFEEQGCASATYYVPMGGGGMPPDPKGSMLSSHAYSHCCNHGK